MTLHQLVVSSGSAYDGRMLPLGLVYDKDICFQFCRKQDYFGNCLVKQTSTEDRVAINKMFYRFPYLYGRSGTLYRSSGLPAVNRDIWIEKVTGRKPGAVDKQIEGEHRSGEEVQSETPKTSVDVFNDVLKMMNDTPPDDSTNVTALREEVDQLKERLEQQELQATKADVERQHSIRQLQHQLAASKHSENMLKSTVSVLRRQIFQSKRQHKEAVRASNSARTRAETAEQNAKVLNKALETTIKQLKKEKQLQVTKDAAADADQRLAKIWTEMKKLKEAERRKRSASDGPAGVESKKARTGT